MAENSIEEVVESKLELCTDEIISTPKSSKRKLTESPEASDSPIRKKYKQDGTESTENNEMLLLTNPKFYGKHKAKTPQAQNDKVKFIKHFVEITSKYAEFLEQKVESSTKAYALKSKNGENGTKGRSHITDQLKYFQGTLRPYQIEGVTWLTILFENSVNGILADEMGLGKTIQIIALLCHLYERKVKGPFLIVAPLSTVGNWESEFAVFAPKIPVFRLQGSQQERREQIDQIKKTHYLDNRRVMPVIICSYQVPLLELNFLQQYCWTYIVVDEGHRLKNSESLLSKQLRALDSVNRTLLTGTPLQNNFQELWSLFNFLMPELFKNPQRFSSLLELEDMKDIEKILENEAETKIISNVHKVLAPFMLRREKALVLKDLVPKKEMIVFCPLTDLQKHIYRSILKKDMNQLQMMKPKEGLNLSERTKRRCTMKIVDYSHLNSSLDDFEFQQNKRLISPSIKVNKDLVRPSPETVPVECPDCEYVCRLTMQNITIMLKKTLNHPYLVWFPLDPNEKERKLFISEDLIKHSGKLMVLDLLLPKLKAQGHKVLIFSTLVMFLDLIEEFLILRKYNFRRMTGDVDYASRNESVSEFNNDPSVFIFLLSTRTGGLGLNLTAADTVIFMDRDWNPMVDIQAQDRCHRIGQTKPVMIYSLIVKNTVDEIILMCGDMKKRLEKIVIQQGKFKTVKKNLDDDELKALAELLNAEQEITTIRANGQIYTDEELNDILDRSALFQQMEENKEN